MILSCLLVVPPLADDHMSNYGGVMPTPPELATYASTLLHVRIKVVRSEISYR